MQVLHTADRVHFVHIPAVIDGKPHESQIETITLLPGFNEIPDDKFALAEKTKGFKARIEQGHIKPLSKPIENLSGMSTGDAKDLVDKTVQIKYLKKWSETEKRDDVKKALELRMADLKVEK